MTQRTEPAVSAVAITPNNSVSFEPTRALFIGGAGNLTVDMQDIGTQITFTGVPAGIIPLAVTRVYATGTTATSIIGLL